MRERIYDLKKGNDPFFPPDGWRKEKCKNELLMLLMMEWWIRKENGFGW